ncbi:MAG TPA: hypothetical protein VHN80_03035 [Kineosporiaceae bacterium]|nr:hypothetical protein [Kineosporiaceae bacterium]
MTAAEQLRALTATGGRWQTAPGPAVDRPLPAGTGRGRAPLPARVETWHPRPCGAPVGSANPGDLDRLLGAGGAAEDYYLRRQAGGALDHYTGVGAGPAGGSAEGPPCSGWSGSWTPPPRHGSRAHPDF